MRLNIWLNIWLNVAYICSRDWLSVSIILADRLTASVSRLCRTKLSSWHYSQHITPNWLITHLLSKQASILHLLSVSVTNEMYKYNAWLPSVHLHPARDGHLITGRHRVAKQQQQQQFSLSSTKTSLLYRRNLRFSSKSPFHSVKSSTQAEAHVVYIFTPNQNSILLSDRPCACSPCVACL